MLFRGYRFSLNYCLAALATFVLMLVIERMPGLDSSLAVLLILPLLVAATIEGKVFARRNSSKPQGLACCGAALRMTAVSAGLAVGLTWTGALIAPTALASLGLSPADLLGLSVLVFAVVALPVIRCGYAFGLASELRAQRIVAHAGDDV